MADSPHERIRYVLASGHWVNLFYGLIRSKDLGKTRLFPAYFSGDYRLLGELCLRGKFFEVPEYLFFRRIHPKASSQNGDRDWQSEFFKGQRGHVELPFWHICLDHSTTILCSNLSLGHKVGCLGAVANRMISGKRQLLRELHAACRVIFKGTLSYH
jgi:hypothetical protein